MANFTPNRREFLKTTALGLTGLALSEGLFAAQPGGAKKPNFVFVISDQHCGKYTGYMGHKVVRTPNMDRIGQEGVIFENHYSCQPVCAPGRAALMTGLYASDSNAFCNSCVWDGKHPLWTKRLKDAGYHCWATGKMDLNSAFDSGCEEVEVKNEHCIGPDITSLFRRPVSYRVGERDNVNGKARPERDDADWADCERGIDFIKNKAPKLDKPWVAYVGFHMPHPKFVGFKQYFDEYLKIIDMPNVPPGTEDHQPLVYQILMNFKLISIPIPEERIRRARAAYFAMITELDEYIGKLYDALKESGQLDNTVFVYTADHGEALGDHGLWLKDNLYEGGARVPLIMAGGGLPKGKRVNTAVSHVDMAASIIDLAGVPRPKEFRGHSMLPMMRGEGQGEHPGFAYSESHGSGVATGTFMLRKGDWKYIHCHWYDDALFNLKDDPDELKNRINDKAAADVLKELQGLLASQVDPEEVTLRAFKAQQAMLDKFAREKSEDELFEMLGNRLGKGQARVMAKRLKETVA